MSTTVEMPEELAGAAATPFPANPAQPLPSSSTVRTAVARDILGGTSALGVATVLERGLGFAANLLAARLGGVSTFGAYSLAMVTANNIGTYAAGGIGSTAIRFSGKYPRGSAGYRTFCQALVILSVFSAGLAALGLWLGAGPLAHLLRKDSLSVLLRWAAFSAAGMLLLECCRGFFLGQRRFTGIFLLSSIVGLGLLLFLPLASLWGPVAMICGQGAITLAAVLFCLLLFRPLGLAAPVPADGPRLLPVLGEIWRFGLVQLAGLIGVNAAGWWLTSLVARSDTSMAQMGFFAVANQVRNMAALAPGLLAQGSLAAMAENGGSEDNTPDHVMAVCTFFATVASLSLAGLGIVVLPWGLTALYGNSYAPACAAAALALATAIVHMSNAPAAGRLSIVSIKSTGIINTVWAVMVALAATLFLFHAGNAWKAAAIYGCAHLLSAVLVLLALRKYASVPGGMISLFLVSSAVAVAASLLAGFRAGQAQLTVPLTLGLIAVFVAGFVLLLLIGRRYGWLPTAAALWRLVFGSRLAAFVGRARRGVDGKRD